MLFRSSVNSFLDDLLEKKRVTRELGAGPRQAMLDALILDEFEQAEAATTGPTPRQDSLVAEADALFLDLLQRR